MCACVQRGCACACEEEKQGAPYVRTDRWVGGKSRRGRWHGVRRVAGLTLRSRICSAASLRSCRRDLTVSEWATTWW